MKSLIAILYCISISIVTYGQTPKFHLYSEVNMTSYTTTSLGTEKGSPSFELEQKRFIGSEIRVGLEFYRKWWQVGLKLNQFSHSKTTASGNVRLTGGSDITKNTRAFNDFYQLNTTISQRQVALYVGINKNISKFYNVRLNYGLISLSKTYEQQLRFLPDPIDEYNNEFQVSYILDNNNNDYITNFTPYQFINLVIQRPIYKHINLGINYEFITQRSDHSVGIHIGMNL